MSQLHFKLAVHMKSLIIIRLDYYLISLLFSTSLNLTSFEHKAAPISPGSVTYSCLHILPPAHVLTRFSRDHSVD